MITSELIAGAKPLLDFIAKPESGGDYNIVWGGIAKKHRPASLVAMTVGEVLAWQDSIDPLYMSEAAGRYQIMEDTLRSLYREAGVSLNSKYDAATQDRLATALLIRRGYNAFLAGGLTVQEFANNLAKEWASLPVVSGPKAGKSYYGGDGLNKSHVSVDAFLAAVTAARPVSPVSQPAAPTAGTIQPQVAPAAPTQPKPQPAASAPGFWAALVSLIVSYLRSIWNG